MPQSQPANPPIPDTVLCSKDALLEEYAAIIRDDWVDGKPPPRTTQWLRENEAELCAAPKTALCLSGGGIRSAAFCLGALQALAAKRLLGEFNYLSTVSGGGYIGAWLATIMHGGGRGNGALSAANKALTEPADTALRSLRNYTNFLIPEGGFGSSDTWSAIVLWLRNVLLNWLVFAPVLLALAIVPRLYRELLWNVSPFWGAAALLVGLALPADRHDHGLPLGTDACLRRKQALKGWPLRRRRIDGTTLGGRYRCWPGRFSRRHGSARCRQVGTVPCRSCPGPSPPPRSVPSWRLSWVMASQPSRLAATTTRHSRGMASTGPSAPRSARSCCNLAPRYVGRAIHPSYVEGQIQGGVTQGIGWALNEEYIYNSQGHMENPGSLTTGFPWHPTCR